MVFWNCMKIVWLAFFHTFDAGNCMISFFGVGKFKISIFDLWMSTRGHITFPGLFVDFNRFSIKDRSKTAQKPLKSCLKNRSKITARNERFLSGFLSKIWAVWAVFPKETPKPPKLLKPLKSCWKTAQTAHILSGFWAGSRPGLFNLQQLTIFRRRKNAFRFNCKTQIPHFRFSFCYSVTILPDCSFRNGLFWPTMMMKYPINSNRELVTKTSVLGFYYLQTCKNNMQAHVWHFQVKVRGDWCALFKWTNDYAFVCANSDWRCWTETTLRGGSPSTSTVETVVPRHLPLPHLSKVSHNWNSLFKLFRPVSQISNKNGNDISWIWLAETKCIAKL